MRVPSFVLALVAASTIAASADTLYVSAPPATAPGHPLRLGADHRAQQVGDLVTVAFAQAYTNNQSDIAQTSKSLTLGATNILPHLPTSIGGTTGSAVANTRVGTITFESTMVAVVTNVLPSGALQIAGDSRMELNGRPAVLHLTGLVRVEDIDASDTILTTRIAALNANFQGNFEEGKGIIRRFLDAIL